MTSLILSATTTATPDLYRTQKLWAIAITIALVIVVCGVLVPAIARTQAKRPTTRPNPAKQHQAEQRQKRLEAIGSQPAAAVLFGADNRISTSRTIAMAWTAVVAYVVIALLLVWPRDWATPLKNLYPTYLLLLGGPYAALILSMGITTWRTSSGSLTKTIGDGSARLSDLIADDSGRSDAFDSQYVVFNLLAMWFVIGTFWRATLQGFPVIPGGLILLTAGPAAVYLSNKLFGSTVATITAVTPSRVTEGDTFSVRGSGFRAGQLALPGQGKPGQVLVGGRTAGAPDSNWDDTTIQAVAPDVADQDGTAVDVQVITGSGLSATLRGGLTVDCRPHPLGFSVSSAAPGDPVTMRVAWPARTSSGAHTTITVGQVIIDGPVVAGPEDATCTFTIPRDLGVALPTSLPVTIRAGNGPASSPVPLQIRA